MPKLILPKKQKIYSPLIKTNMTQLLQQVARKNNGISYGVRVALKQKQETEALLMLKSMTRDNEKLMLRDFGPEIVKKIKEQSI